MDGTAVLAPPALAAQLTRCLAPAETACSLPPALYADESLVRVEAERVFRRGWIGLGRADQLRVPGSYRAREIAGAPVILLRDKTGRLRAYANTCRHRGARLLDGEGEIGGIRCPFHCWAYALDGRLIGAPRMDDAPGFEKAQHGLHAYSVAERAGFAFLSFEAAPPDLDAQLGDFEARHAPWPLARLVSTRRRELTVDCNWKAFLDVFNEYYHLPYVHADSIDALYDDPDPGETVSGAYASQFGVTSGAGGLLQDEQEHALPSMPGLSGRAATGVRYSWVFPNMTFAAGTDALWVYEASPESAGRCRVAQTICFPPETIEEPGFAARAERYYHRMDAALAEDVAALESQQRGLASPDAAQGRFCAALEPNVAAFARWCAGRLLGEAGG